MRVGDDNIHVGNEVEQVRDDTFLVRSLRSIEFMGDSVHHLELHPKRVHQPCSAVWSLSTVDKDKTVERGRDGWEGANPSANPDANHRRSRSPIRESNFRFSTWDGFCLRWHTSKSSHHAQYHVHSHRCFTLFIARCSTPLAIS